MLGIVKYSIRVFVSIDWKLYIITLFRNDYYQLGDGTTQRRGDGIGEMGDNLAAVDLGTDFVPIDIEAGGQHVCAMTQSNEVKCWGQLILSLSIQYLYRLCYSAIIIMFLRI